MKHNNLLHIIATVIFQVMSPEESCINRFPDVSSCLVACTMKGFMIVRYASVISVPYNRNLQSYDRNKTVNAAKHSNLNKN
jgi:hypothetical protein